MANLEKKYSDFQKEECEDFVLDSPEVLDEKLCPTCQPNPNFKLEANWWEIEEAYLNEKYCEYHVRVYQNEPALEDKSQTSVFNLASERILVDLDKPLNDGTRTQVSNACYIKNKYKDIRSGALGEAYLVAVPAFNFDQIEPNDSENSTQDDSRLESVEEIVLEASGLYRKLRQLKWAIKAYGGFYSLAQGNRLIRKDKETGFVIRQEANETARVNYDWTASRINDFTKEINKLLKDNGYAKLNRPGLFKSKRAEKIKLLFGQNYKLEKLLVLPDDGCDKYEKIKVPKSSPLRKGSLAVVYNFLANIEEVINDITSKETKPWLDFTLEYFYPKYIVDYGSLEEINETKAGLECLLEERLGVGNGQVIDFLSKQVLSAFDSIEDELAKQLCEGIGGTPKSTAQMASEKGGDDPKPKEERKQKMIARYKKEYESKIVLEMVDYVNNYYSSIFEDSNSSLREEANVKISNKNNVLEKMKEYGIPFAEVKVPEYSYTSKTSAGNEKITANVGVYQNIYEKSDIERNAEVYAEEKFRRLEEGSFGNQIENSPHYQEFLEASSELLKKPDTSFLMGYKDAASGESELDTSEAITVFGLCGITSIAGRALECIASGVSFDTFLGILVEKALDYMELNTFSLFLNGLPAGFRDELNQTINEQFGNVNLSDLLNIKKSEDGNQKLKDFVKSKQTFRLVYEKLEELEGRTAQGEDLAFLEQHLPKPIIDSAIDKINRIKINEYLSREEKEEELKTHKKETKKEFRKFKVQNSKFKQAADRIASAVGESVSDVRENLEERKEINKKLILVREQIETERSKVRDLIASENMSELITLPGATLRPSEAAKEELRNIAQKVLDYKSVEADLVEQLEGLKVSSKIKDKTEEVKQRINEAGYDLAIGILAYQDDFFGTLNQSLDNFEESFNSIGNQELSDEDLSPYEQASRSFKETSLGVKVDAVFDVVFDFIIDSILDSFGLDDLFSRLNKYPIVNFVSGKVKGYLSECTRKPVFYPPPGDFMKSLSVDLCDPNVSLTIPKVNIPSINFRFMLESQFSEMFREAIVKLITDLAIKLLTRLMGSLEGALCNLLEAAGGFATDALKNGLPNTAAGVYNGFIEALNEAFCNDGENPDTARSRAEELAEALFSPISFNPNTNYEGQGARVSNIISSVASTREFLEAMVSPEGEENDQFNKRVANAVSTLAPEMSFLLGDPSQVAYFFHNLGSYLSPEEQERIRDLLDAGIPNLPISPAICLTNEQLNAWNDLRDDLLNSPEDPTDWVDVLNNETEKALSDLMDDIGDLSSTGEPFFGAITNEALKDVCNPNNIINASSESDFDKEQQEELVDNFFNNLSKSIERGFFGKGGILAEALADTRGTREIFRGFKKIFQPNYTNSQAERDAKYSQKFTFPGQFLMDVMTENGEAIGEYPPTVAIKQRKQILEVEEGGGRSYNMSGENSRVVYKFSDSSDDFSYSLKVRANNSIVPKNKFDYRLQVEEETDNESVIDISFNTEVRPTQEEEVYMSSIGFQYNTNQNKNIRQELFGKIVQSKLPLNRSWTNLYAQSFESLNKSLSTALLSDYSRADSIPVGYEFGYTSDTLTKDSFKYTPSQNEGELGTFADSRIIPLDPAIYGGSHKNPAFYVEPRQFTGWVEVGRKAFSSEEGCEPKTPPLFDMTDIKQRVKTLNSSMQADPRLSKDPDCSSVKPFHLLLDNKNKANLDGVVRTTLRTYLGEYFIKGYGLFSNLQVRPDNFDQSMSKYIVSKMKKEMSDLGLLTNNRKVRIVRERYWYTFLEQCVEAYQRMVDVDGLNPPNSISSALNRIQKGLDKYRVIDKRIKKQMIAELPALGKSSIKKPPANYNPLAVVSSGMVNLGLQAIAFRLTDEEERETFFDGGVFENLQKIELRFASLKKIQFFQKIYFIKLFEREAELIMSELVRLEINRMTELFVDGISDKPNYFDLSRAIFGMKDIFEKSNSRVGLNEFYVDKQRGVFNPGSIPEIPNSNLISPVASTEEVQFVIESYVRLKDRRDITLPQVIGARSNKYKGAVSLSAMSEFVSSNLSFLEDKNLSDFFGDLSFLYTGSLKSLFDKGFTSSEDINKLVELNKERGALMASRIREAQTKYVLGQDFENINVSYDESFLIEGDNPQPTGTKGDSGVKYGIRMSIVFPKNMSESTIAALKNNAQFVEKSKKEKSYIFEDGTFSLPILEAEVGVKDSSFMDFDPFNGVEPFDLECLINKMVSTVEFQVLMDKVFNIKQASSMLAIYCMETLPAAIGRDPSERDEQALNDDPDVDDWDRVTNKFAKNYLRREFKSIYLNRHPDGQSPDDDDDSENSRMLRLNNPLDFFSLPSVKLPWWLKRKMRTKIYDANGEECADPKKDLK
jgi:hypothetical protein